MLSGIPFEVVARRDLRMGEWPQIKGGMCGKVTGLTRAMPGLFSVTFWPLGPEGIGVTIGYVTGRDVSARRPAPMQSAQEEMADAAQYTDRSA